MRFARTRSRRFQIMGGANSRLIILHPRRRLFTLKQRSDCRMESKTEPQVYFEFLSELLLSEPRFSEAVRKTLEPGTVSGTSSHLADIASHLSPERFDALRSLAVSNHVIVRALRLLRPMLAARGNHDATQCVAAALQEERLRIDHALQYLHKICAALEQNGCSVTIIKSLDHWPDLGSDLDLYTDADASKIVQV